MTRDLRVERLAAIYDELTNLLTIEEVKLYPVLEHLEDLIEDARKDEG